MAPRVCLDQQGTRLLTSCHEHHAQVRTVEQRQNVNALAQPCCRHDLPESALAPAPPEERASFPCLEGRPLDTEASSGRPRRPTPWVNR